MPGFRKSMLALLFSMMALVASSVAVQDVAGSSTNTTSYNEPDFQYDEEEEAAVDQVECSSTQNEFEAQTDFILEGQGKFLDSRQRRLLQNVFIDIYNKISRDNCDLYFRRLSSLELIQMTNSLRNETIFGSDTNALALLDLRNTTGGGPLDGFPDAFPGDILDNLGNLTDNLPGGILENLGNFTDSLPEGIQDGLGALQNLTASIAEDLELPEKLPDDLPGTILDNLPEDRPNLPGPFGQIRGRMLVDENGINATTTTPSSTELSYAVVGTCRECPLTGTGSFDLYDDTFRLRGRDLRLRVRMRVLKVRPQISDGPPPSLPIMEGGNLPLSGNNDVDNSDCTCAAGLKPTSPRAPKVTELLEVVNERLDRLQIDRPEGGFLEGRLSAIQQTSVMDDLPTTVLKEAEGGV